jgi:hypothetical protein
MRYRPPTFTSMIIHWSGLCHLPERQSRLDARRSRRYVAELSAADKQLITLLRNLSGGFSS